ncbi:hypothetical protein BD0120_05320 [Helicobacter pylori]
MASWIESNGLYWCILETIAFCQILILYQTNKDNVKILAILSVKNSFRERFTETPYWKLKLLQSPVTSHIKVFMITPDNDDEISFKNKPKKALSWSMNEMASI